MVVKSLGKRSKPKRFLKRDECNKKKPFFVSFERRLTDEFKYS